MIFLLHVEWPEMLPYKLLLTFYVWRIVWRPWRPFVGHPAWSWTTLRRGNVFCCVYKRFFKFLSRFLRFKHFFKFLFERFFTSMLNSTTRTRPDQTHGPLGSPASPRGLCLVVDLSSQSRHVRTLSVYLVWSGRRRSPWVHVVELDPANPLA